MPDIVTNQILHNLDLSLGQIAEHLEPIFGRKRRKFFWKGFPCILVLGLLFHILTPLHTKWGHNH